MLKKFLIFLLVLVMAACVGACDKNTDNLYDSDDG